MTIGLIIIIIYILIWITGNGVLYDIHKNFFYNLGVNIFLIIGIILFIKDLKKTLNKRKENKK